MTTAALGVVGVALLAGMVLAATPPGDAGPMLRFTATTANVTGAPDSIRIDLFRWSTGAEREKLRSAWDMKPAAAGRSGGGRGGGRGRGGARGGAPAVAATPESQLALALKEASTIGYLWSSEAAGYAVRYAGKFALPDGTDRIILITDRRLGEANGLWRAPNQTTASPYDFSIIELRVNAKGIGEGKLSLGEKVAPDGAGIVALVNYDSLPVVFANLKQVNRVKQ